MKKRSPRSSSSAPSGHPVAPRPRKPPTAEEIHNAALRLLSHRPRSQAKVRRGLQRRFPDSPEMVEAAMARLTEAGLLDDAAFARFWTEGREQHRPRGRAAIRWELLRMGVQREVVEESLEGLDEEENALRAAQESALQTGP